ncbi:probable RNA-directed DNA polymerase from transposon BS [Trichonephila inaurata madagascariensis]|uniref:Probable RNA-directed DNA polymerase from transposon BS n=1 Tax=Trichonephila inaurata madagascariensis TaxID=2747483 RepID=A0A8X7CEG7_9ARAC|nr:probable RNA-directed DNA polymerase from transposon BS [Trichonephila inaurata madagascariensis]
MIVDRLQYYMDSCGHISEKQAGLRRSYNTTEQNVLTQHIKDSFQKKQSTLGVFVVFKSAFDRRFLSIKYGNSCSGYGQSRQGLPQGSVLSPVLFNIMINDLLSFIDNAVPEINFLLYADDLVLWPTGSDIPTLESTQNSALVTLANWSLENDFKVNPDKTDFELFTLSTKKHNVNFVYNNHVILRTDCATYFGISLDSRLSWTEHIAKVVENATTRPSLLKRIAGVKWGSSRSVLTSTFTSYIRRVIDYASELLVTASDSALLKLDIVQNKALRFITGASTSTPIASMGLQTEISSSSERRQYSALSLGEQLIRKKYFWPYKHLPKQDLKLNILSCLSSRDSQMFLMFPIIDFPSLDRLPYRVI